MTVNVKKGQCSGSQDNVTGDRQGSGIPKATTGGYRTADRGQKCRIKEAGTGQQSRTKESFAGREAAVKVQPPAGLGIITPDFEISAATNIKPRGPLKVQPVNGDIITQSRGPVGGERYFIIARANIGRWISNDVVRDKVPATRTTFDKDAIRRSFIKFRADGRQVQTIIQKTDIAEFRGIAGNARCFKSRKGVDQFTVNINAVIGIHILHPMVGI